MSNTSNMNKPFGQYSNTKKLNCRTIKCDLTETMCGCDKLRTTKCVREK
jgi:hypothetical protein